jgi:hypothetical protein
MPLPFSGAPEIGDTGNQCSNDAYVFILRELLQLRDIMDALCVVDQGVVAGPATAVACGEAVFGQRRGLPAPPFFAGCPYQYGRWTCSTGLLQVQGGQAIGVGVDAGNTTTRAASAFAW